MQIIYVGPSTGVVVTDAEGNEYEAERDAPIEIPDELAESLLRQGSPVDFDDEGAPVHGEAEAHAVAWVRVGADASRAKSRKKVETEPSAPAAPAPDGATEGGGE